MILYGEKYSHDLNWVVINLTLNVKLIIVKDKLHLRLKIGEILFYPVQVKKKAAHW